MPRRTETDVHGLLKKIVETARDLQGKSNNLSTTFTQLPDGAYVHITASGIHASYSDKRTGKKYTINISSS